MLPSNMASRPRTGRHYQSRRAVKRHHVPSHVVTQWTTIKIALLCGGGTILAILMLGPIMVLDSTGGSFGGSQDNFTLNGGASHVGPTGSLLHASHNVRSNWKEFVQHERDFLAKEEKWLEDEIQKDFSKLFGAAGVAPPEETLPPQQEDNLGLGVSGLPLDRTPALLGAEKAHIECDVDVDYLAYWNYPQGLRDRKFDTPFRQSHDRELFFTFQPDPGGWNNIRMSMETIFVLAAATGRTLVLPPRAPFYLLAHGKQGARSFGSFFDMSKMHPSLKIITMEEFYRTQGQNLLGLEAHEVEHLSPIADICTYAGSPESNNEHCDHIYGPLRESGWQPPVEALKDCLVFDHRVYESDTDENVPEDILEQSKRFCGKRKLNFYNSTWSSPTLLHWNAASLETRLLNHFYTFMLFTDPVVDNFYKRFVRDYLHYNDEIYCAAGKVINALRKESPMFSTMHTRRGDFQYTVVKLPAEELYENTKEIWKPNEPLYIATDEMNRTFFDPIAKHHPVRVLGDYWEVANLGSLDKTYLGMIDTVVASQGRTFAGTWFSTFTGFINRLRGYYGYSMKDSWYSWLERKTAVQNWTYPKGNYPAREWPICWVGIDGDEVIEHELNHFPNPNAKFVGMKEAPAIGGAAGALLATQEKAPKPVKRSFEARKTDDGRTVPVLKLSDLDTDEGVSKKPLGRGVAGLPDAETPALVGGSRGTLQCDINVDSLAYWNNPQGDRDRAFKSPFAVEGETKYISFSPDRGGWNNVRMSLEIIFVLAAASGRTLVLPPELNLYRLSADKEKTHRGFADFFPLYFEAFRKKVPVITMKEFMEREGGANGRVPIPEEQMARVTGGADHCENRAKSDRSCQAVFEFLDEAGFTPSFRAKDHCIIFDEDVFAGKPLNEANQKIVQEFCGDRKVTMWDASYNKPVLIHVRSGEKEWRLLTHFYAMIRFTNPAVDNYFKRFVRDFLHYHDSIYCAAGKIVKALQAEGGARGTQADDDGSGGYSAMHIRRGEFQYKNQKFSAETWLANTKEVWNENEVIYIATDERNKTFFRPIAEAHSIRFLDDYWDFAGLGDLDPNYMGMIDTIVASRARAFAGTWFSTFSGYINRMRGYHGLTMNHSWYAFLDRKTALHNWTDQTYGLYAFEWPEGWVGIDGDVRPRKSKF